MTSPVPADLDLPPCFAGFRQHQLESAFRLAGSAVRTSLVSAPTGSGKSLLYMTARQLSGGRQLVLTGTKGLQQQGYNDFRSMKTAKIMGHSNYRCAVADRTPYEPICSNPAGCQYQEAVKRALDADTVFGNYAHWLTMAKYGDPTALGKFDILVCDEFHTAAAWLTSATQTTLARHEVGQLLGLDLPDLLPNGYTGPPDAWLEWVDVAYRKAKDRYREIRDKAGERRPADRDTQRRLQMLTGLGRELGHLASARRSKSSWVVEHVDDRDRGPGLRFTPVWPGGYAESWLFRGIERVIAVSATLSPATGRYLGIDDTADPPTSEYIEVPSTFEARRRPLIYIPTAKMQWNMDAGSRARVFARMDRYIGSRLGHKGLVQVPSYDLAHEIASKSKHAEHFITHGRGPDARKTVERFMDDETRPPAILASPVIKEGWDFAGRRARWQVIAKVPLLDRRDPLTKARCADDLTWHDVQVADAIMQMVGRLMRSTTDWGETCIFDKHFGWLMMKSHLWPQWFRAAWRTVRDEIPAMTTFGDDNWEES